MLQNPSKIVRTMKEQAKFKRSELELLPITLGKVLVSSGRAFDASRRIIDWAFVEMPPTPKNKKTWSSSTKNQLPHPDAAGIFRHLPFDYGDYSSIYVPGNPLPSIEGFSELEMGKWYFKIGRTTDMTAGICHGTKMILRTSGSNELTGARTQYDKSGDHRMLSNPVDFIEEYIILNARLGVTTMQHEDFSQPGDSGALIIDATGAVAGLMYGNYSAQTGPMNVLDGTYHAAGLVTTMPNVLKSIAMKTTPRDASGKPTGPPGQLLLP